MKFQEAREFFYLNKTIKVLSKIYLEMVALL